MIVNGLVPCVVTFIGLIHGFYSQGWLNEAYEMLGKMVNMGQQLDVYACTVFIDRLCKKNKVEEAVCLLNRIEAGGLVTNKVTYTTIIIRYCKEGKINVAFQVFDRMIIWVVTQMFTLILY